MPNEILCAGAPCSVDVEPAPSFVFVLFALTWKWVSAVWCCEQEKAREQYFRVWSTPTTKSTSAWGWMSTRHVCHHHDKDHITSNYFFFQEHMSGMKRPSALCMQHKAQLRWNSSHSLQQNHWALVEFFLSTGSEEGGVLTWILWIHITFLTAVTESCNSIIIHYWTMFSTSVWDK